MTSVLVAPDAFKGSLTAPEAARLIVQGLRDVRPDLEIRTLPLADGGEGTAEVLQGVLGGDWIEQEVTHPLPHRRVRAAYLHVPGARPDAVVEMARASGLPLLAPGERDPLATTTRGTGELIAHARGSGARHLWLTLGGSATVDGGTGAASALGWRFLDARGRPVPDGGRGLAAIRDIVPPERPPEGTLVALCDVDNPLLGPRGAARVFGPQKGATPMAVERLEAGLSHLADRIRVCLGRDVSSLPSGGAAGGFGAGAVAFLGATLERGIDRIVEAIGLARIASEVDWVLTGEGRLDGQSFHGKVVSGVVDAVGGRGPRVGVLAGRIELDDRVWREAGVAAAEACAGPDVPDVEAMARAPDLLRRAARRFAERHLTGADEGGSASGMRFDRVDPASQDARWCLDRYYEELGERFQGGFDAHRSSVRDPAAFAPPTGLFLVGRIGERPVACGAIRRIDPERAYVKRMWVDASVRGRGLGRAMLGALEAAAAEMGCVLVQLETNRALPEAIRLYRTSGYREVPPFNDELYAHHWFEKRLEGSPIGGAPPASPTGRDDPAR